MNTAFIRFWILVAALGLSACVSPPSSDPAPSHDAPLTGVAPRSAVPVPPPAVVSLPDNPPVPAAADTDAHLLAGETPRELEQGKASWYGPRFHGRRTASGERYDAKGLTAAHRTLPFGTLVRVRSLVNGKEVDVRITDRGPFSRNRVIDLSRAAAEAIDMLGLGVKDVLLLVPESTPAMVEVPPPARRQAPPRRAPAAR